MNQILIVFLLIFSINVHGRVFNFDKESIGTFLRGSGGFSTIGKDAFSEVSGSDTVFTDEVQYTFSGELGVVLRLLKSVNIRLGAEYIQAKPLNEIPGKRSSGEKRFDLTSKLVAFNPEATIEINFFRSSQLTAFIFSGIGFSVVSLDNEYVLTPEGQSDFPGVANYTEKSAQNTISSHFGVGLETLFVDNVTAAIELGYRHFPLDELKYKETVATIDGTRTKDTQLINADGSSRKLDMGGLYLGLSFRFYIQVF